LDSIVDTNFDFVLVY